MAGTDLGFYSFVIMLAMIMMMMAGYKDDFDRNDDFDVLHDEYDMQVCSYEACNIFKLFPIYFFDSIDFYNKYFDDVRMSLWYYTDMSLFRSINTVNRASI